MYNMYSINAIEIYESSYYRYTQPKQERGSACLVGVFTYKVRYIMCVIVVCLHTNNVKKPFNRVHVYLASLQILYRLYKL